jgi:hypothetical protein
VLKIYYVHGIRHHTVTFASTAEEAVNQALASHRVGDWEAPKAEEISIPHGYTLHPARQSLAWLTAAMTEAWTFLVNHSKDLTDAEFFWEPAPDCWTVHPAENGRWMIDYADPAPDPPPMTTIAWRLVHLAACKLMYYEYAFGPGRLTWDELEIPHTAADTILWLETGQSQLESAAAGLIDADLAEMRPTNWGEQWPTWRIFWVLAAHDMHHGAEIGCLRDFYRIRGRSR